LELWIPFNILEKCTTFCTTYINILKEQIQQFFKTKWIQHFFSFSPLMCMRVRPHQGQCVEIVAEADMRRCVGKGCKQQAAGREET
jgi:hypothetical protein